MEGTPNVPPINTDVVHSDQELRDTIQHLAIQNMHLTVAKNKAEVLLHQLGVQDHLIKREVSHLTESSILPPLPSTSADCHEEEREMTDVASNDLCDGKTAEVDDDRGKRNKIEMDKFKEDLSNRREARHKAISAVSSELERLRAELNDEKTAREAAEQELKKFREESRCVVNQDALLQELARVKNELADEKDRNENVCSENKRVMDENEQLTNSLTEEKLQFEQDRAYSQRRIGALKDVAELSKQMLAIRENQVADLKAKIKHLEDRPKVNSDSTQLQAEFDAQKSSIQTLKLLYEDRMKIVTAEKEKFKRESEDKAFDLETYVNKCSALEGRLTEMESIRSDQDDMNASLQTRLDLSLEESKSLSKEIALINNMFTQMLVGNSATDLDLDKLTRLLQENHDLITEMTTKEDGTDTAASLPKLLWDLLNQIDKDETTVASTSSAGQEEQATKETTDENVESNPNTTSSPTQDQTKTTTEDTPNSLAVEEIASNLPKVWKVLMELLSHHVAPTPSEDIKSSCYKCIDTPTGPQFVPSVSNTYIRLKDLILEKKSLQKDLGKLKQLNGHLELKLHEQEKRLICVSAELSKTWGVVGRLRSQFKQLHTHEQILRYELQQKRHLLTELKKELEYCREKWEKARQKDKETEVEWTKLRQEFASRKLQDHNNSRESGFFDEKEAESGEDERSLSPKSLTSLPSPSASDTCDESPPLISEANSPPEEQESVNCIDPPGHTDFSWITLVKLQSLFTSRQQTEEDIMRDARDLESIFSMKPIQIPDSLQQETIEHNTANIVSIPVEKASSPEGKCTAIPETSAGPSTCKDTQVRDALGRTPEEALAARAARLKRLEEQTQLLFKKVTRTTNRSVALSNRLEELHEQYGVPNPPPLPVTLPALRIPVVGGEPGPTDTATLQETSTSYKYGVPNPPPLPVTLPAVRIPVVGGEPGPTDTATLQETSTSYKYGVPNPPPLPVTLPAVRIPVVGGEPGTTDTATQETEHTNEESHKYGVPNPPPLPVTLPAVRIPVVTDTTATANATPEPVIPQETAHE